MDRWTDRWADGQIDNISSRISLYWVYLSITAFFRAREQLTSLCLWATCFRQHDQNRVVYKHSNSSEISLCLHEFSSIGKIILPEGVIT